MKRVLVLVVALLTMLAFASGVMAQAPAKTEKPAAPAPEKAAPALAPKPAAEKPKALKPKAPKPIEGKVAAYEAGKMIKVKGAKEKEWTFEATADTKIINEVKEGVKVKVAYKKEGEKMIATTITGPKPKPPKKEAPKPKEAPKK